MEGSGNPLDAVLLGQGEGLGHRLERRGQEESAGQLHHAGRPGVLPQVEYALTQTRYAASYGADKQHEATSFSLALLAATERLKVIAAVHPGLWHPGVLAKLGATADHLSKGRFAVNVVSGWFKGEFTAAFRTEAARVPRGRVQFLRRYGAFDLAIKLAPFRG